VTRTAKTKERGRIGGRGCPGCGSHDTDGFPKTGVAFCHTCSHRWQVCRPGCRGYALNVEAKGGPAIEGCGDCGVPDRIARLWPEAWRAMAKRLDAAKLEAVVD